MEIWVNLEFGDGNFERGFSINLKVTVANTQPTTTQIEVELPPDAEIPISYQRWKEQYYSLLVHSRKGFKNNQITHISKTDCYDSARHLRHQLHQWLRSTELQLRQKKPQDSQSKIHLVIHTEKIPLEATKDILHRLPWQEWDFFGKNSSCEAAVCFNSSVANTTLSEASTPNTIRRARIISIFGDSTNIDTSVDKELLEKLKKRAAELIVLTEPNRSDFNTLWEEACDILFFAGHSETKGDGQTGIININRNDSLSLKEIKRTLRAAINKGLKLAIFNSCDGLGLARRLADLNLPYIIIWREEVPDQIAQKFLKYFLSSFAEGKSLFTAVREARDKLKELADDKDIEKQLPGVSWLPIICRNTTEPPPTWQDLGGLSGQLPDCPYRSLSAFRQEDAPFFFGREKFIADLVEKVNSNSKPLVAVIGASGSGKSSVVFAGLIPRLADASDVLIVSFRPGKNPFDALAVSLSNYDQSQRQQEEKNLEELGLELDLRHEKTKLSQVIEKIIRSSSYQRLVLVADQFEELYTLATETERQPFLDALLYAVEFAQGFTLVITLRADFLRNVLDYQPFGEALQRYAPLLLTSMNREELQNAIANPAAKMKLELEQGLTTRLIHDLGDQPGRLPLLEFTLTQLWSKQKNWYLTHQAYEEIGGLEKALTKYADDIFNQLSATDQEKAKKVFIQLMHPGEGTEDTRRVASRNEVGEENWDLVKRLADARLVVTGWDEIDQIETVEVVHEALIREWGILRKWIKASREFRIWQERLKLEVCEWENHHKHQEALLQGKRLVIAEDWYKQRADELTPRERDFITASIQQRDNEQRQHKRRRQLTIFGLTSGLVVTLVLAIAAWGQWQNSQKSELKAISESSAALFASNQKLDALVEAIRARRKLQKLVGVDADTQHQVELVLRRAVYGAIEYNRLSHHSSEFKKVVFSPDGERIASTSDDKTIKIWKTDGTLLTTLKGHQDTVWDVAFNRYNNTIVSVSADKTVKMWKQDGTLLATLKGHQASVTGVALSPDGKTIASASEDKTIKLWRTSDGALLHTLNGHQARVLDVVYSSDGETIASVSGDKTIKLWNKNGILLTTLKGHSDTVWAVAFSPDGKTIASASEDKTIKLWKASDGFLLNTLEGHQAPVTGVAFSPDGKMITSASWDKSVKLWNKDGVLLTTLNGHTERVWGVAFSPQGNTIASASDDNTVKLWKLNNTLLTTLRGHSATAIGVTFSPDGKAIASTSDDKTIKLWSQDGALLHTLKGQQLQVYGVAFSPDGQIIASGSMDKTIKLWKVSGRTSVLLKTLKGHSDAVWGVAFSPDGKAIASASWDNTVKLWSRDGALLHTLKGHQARVWGVAFSPDGKAIASASGDNTVKLWRVSDGSLLSTFKGHQAPVTGVAFSPDGQTIASASWDKSVKLWNKDGTLLTTLKGHKAGVFGVTFSPVRVASPQGFGKIIASASGDHTIKLWKVLGTEFIPLTTLNGHSDRVWGTAFSPDGKKLVSASEDKTVILWNLDQVVDLDQVMAYGCNWVRDYLKTNSDVSESVSVTPRDRETRHLCDGIVPH